MRVTKQARLQAKALFRECFDPSGRLDEAKTRQVVGRVIAEKPRMYKAVLTHFQRLLRLYAESRKSHVDNAVETPPEMKARIQAALEARYGAGLQVTFGTDPTLLGGLRIQVGSDVYDGSVRGRLEDLKARF